MAKQFRPFPHQFKPGEMVFLRPSRHPFGMQPFEVVKRLDGPRGEWPCFGLPTPRWPHYLVRDPAGDEWTVSQLEVLSRPLDSRGKLLAAPLAPTVEV